MIETTSGLSINETDLNISTFHWAKRIQRASDAAYLRQIQCVASAAIPRLDDFA
jgi:hypothetical protein